MVTIRETTENDLSDVQRLWADGDVMKFFGFPDGLQETDEAMVRWYQWIASERPRINHYSVFYRFYNKCWGQAMNLVPTFIIEPQ